MSRMLPLAALPLFALLALPGCDADAQAMCTRIAMISVTVNVTDADGAPVTDVEVTYEADGTGVESCDSYEDGVYFCGYEVAGEVFIAVGRGDDVLSSNTVLVEADECHVIPVTLDVVVPSAA